MNTRALVVATVVGTILQVGMVLLAHSNKSVASLTPFGGMGFSLIAGLIYAWIARGSGASALAMGGALSGGICAFIGILIFHLMGDAPASLLALGTLSSVVTGAIGGWIGRFVFRGNA
jgi:hypothetical protein